MQDGEKYIYSCEYVKHRVYSWLLFINYCIIFHIKTVNPLLPHPVQRKTWNKLEGEQDAPIQGNNSKNDRGRLRNNGDKIQRNNIFEVIKDK